MSTRDFTRRASPRRARRWVFPPATPCAAGRALGISTLRSAKPRPGWIRCRPTSDRHDACAYQFGRVEVRPATRQLLVDGQTAALGARAFDLLLALIERRDRLVTKSELLELVWPGLIVEENNLQVQVSALRKLLGQDAIATVAGRGYRFTLKSTQTKCQRLDRLVL